MSHVNYLFTSESVSEGHPDKVCDQISDAILDAFIENDVKLGIADDSKINTDRKSTRLNSSHIQKSRMPSSA